MKIMKEARVRTEEDKKKLIQIVGDMIDDVKNRKDEALKEYSAAYGPLTIDTAEDSCTERWNWINEPWPWQEGGC